MLRSSNWQSARLLPGAVQDQGLPGPSGRTAIGAVPRLENGWASGPWGFDSLSFRRSGVVELARRAAVTREAHVRSVPPEPDPARPGCLRGGGAAVLASLMSSRPRVESR